MKCRLLGTQVLAMGSIAHIVYLAEFALARTLIALLRAAHLYQHGNIKLLAKHQLVRQQIRMVRNEMP